MYIALATPLSSTPRAISVIRAPHPSPDASIQRVTSAATPTSSALATVPRPGDWRSGIHSRSTTTETAMMMVPRLRGMCRAMPWWSTSHGMLPSTPRTMSAIEAP